MAIYIHGTSMCKACGNTIDDASTSIAFPAFVPKGHVFHDFSDSIFHSHCFENWQMHTDFLKLYDQYREIWKSRPIGVSYDEAERWGREAFVGIFKSGMSSII